MKLHLPSSLRTAIMALLSVSTFGTPCAWAAHTASAAYSDLPRFDFTGMSGEKGLFICGKEITVTFDNVRVINFSNNSVTGNGCIVSSGGSNGGLNNLTINNADNVIFENNSAASGVIGRGEQPSVWSGDYYSRMTINNVTDTVSFKNNTGSSLFFCTAVAIKNAGALEFIGGSRIVRGYNQTMQFLVGNVEDVTFSGQSGTEDSLLFKECNAYFVKCGNVRFENIRTTLYLHDDASDFSFIALKNLRFENNTATEGRLIGKLPQVNGITDTFSMSGNTIYAEKYTSPSPSLIKGSVSIYGGAYSASTESCTGKGVLCEFKDNTSYGACRAMVTEGTLTVDGFQTFRHTNNRMLPWERSSSDISVNIYWPLAYIAVFNNVDRIEITDNIVTSTVAAGHMGKTLTAKDFGSLEISGNVFSGGKMQTYLFHRSNITGRPDGKSTVSISGNSFSSTDGLGYVGGDTSTSSQDAVQTYCDLASFTYSDNIYNLASISGNSVGGQSVGLGTPSFTNVANITISGNIHHITGAYDTSAVSGGAFTYSGTLPINRADSLVFSNNAITCEKTAGGIPSCKEARGGAISGGELALRGNKKVVAVGNSVFGASKASGGFSYTSNILMEGNGDINISGNSVSSLADGSVYGGAIYSGGSSKSYPLFSGNASLTITDNYADSTMSITGHTSGGSAYGGAIYTNHNLTLTEDSPVVVRGNHVDAFSKAAGGAFYVSNSLELTGVDMEFRGNYHKIGSDVALDAIYANKLDVTARTAKGSVRFYDGVSVAGSLVVNTTAEPCGTVLFSGEYAPEDLARISPSYTAQDLADSKLVYVKSSVTVNSGKLVFRQRNVNSASVTVAETATMGVEDSTMTLTGKMNVKGRLNLSGKNNITATTVTLAAGSSLSFTLENPSKSATATTLAATLVQSGTLSVNIDFTGDVGKYALLSTKTFKTSLWTQDNVKVTGADFSELLWQNNTLYLKVTAPVLADPEGNTWTSTLDGKKLVFTQKKNYTISGKVTPAKIVVEGDGARVFSGSGSIAGSASLDKSGSSTLTINTANTYTGGTKISGGAISAKNVKALGTGAVTMTGGSLYLNSLAVANTINVNGTASLKGGSAYKGNLTLTKGMLTGDKINLASGKTVTLKSGSLKNVLAGAGKVVKDTTDTACLFGANTYTGGTTIKAGTLETKNVKALGTGAVTMTGGTLHMNSLAMANTVNVNGTSAIINGGTAYRGNLTLTKGTLSGQNINLYTGKTATLKTGTVKNVLAGAGKVVKDTTGTVTLNGANTYKGGTTVKAGVLSAKNVKSLGTGAVTMTGGTLHLNSLAATNAINVNASSAIIKGSTKYNGRLTLTKGTLSGDKINLTSGKNAYLKTGTVKNALGGTGHVYKQGTGTVTLAGTNKWTGNTYVQGGSLVITGATTLRGTTRTYANSKLDIRRAVTMGNLYLGGGTLALKAGNMLTVTGTLTLANATKLALSGVTASSPVLIKYGKLSNTSKKSLAQFFGLTSAYTVTNKGGKLTIAKAGTKKGTAEFELGETYTATPNTLGQGTWGTARAARLFDHTVRDHAQAQSVALDKNRSVWFAGMSGFSHVDDAADTNIYGGAIGMQFNGSMGGNVGLAIGQTFGHVSPAGASRVKQQTQHAGIYGTKMLYTSATDNVSLTGTASYGTTDSDHEGFDWTQHSAVLGVRGTWEHKVNQSTAVYGFAGLEYLATDAECGSGSVQALQGSIGAGISHTEGRLTLHADASFTPDMVRNAPSATVSTGRLGFEIGAGATYRLSDQWSINAGYTYHNEKRADSHEAYIGARCTF